MTHPAPILVLSLLSLASCVQPAVPCTSAHGTFAAAYKLKKGDAESPCGSLPGEVIGMQSYFAGGGPDNKQRYDKGSVAMTTESLGLLIERAESQAEMPLSPAPEANAVGAFTAGTPGDDEFCEIPKLSPITAKLAEVPAVEDDPETPDDDESLDIQPAVDIRYEWSNARFLVTADAQGTQFTADLEYTRDGCTAEYEVTGVYPVIGCEVDKDCKCVPFDPEAPVPGDPDECVPTGMNPDYAVECHPELKLCVLSEAPPSYL
jgi:hypothetical protein